MPLFTLLTSLLVLGLLIFVHELGHFLLAKMNGVGVLEFSIGFGKKLWKRKFGETTYSIGLIPLGGYVRMVGDDPREMGQPAPASRSQPPDAAPADTAADSDLPLLADRSRWFLKKGFVAKTSIVIAGPLFNLLFALVLSVATIWIYGALEPLDLPIIGDVIPGYPAEKAGIQGGDVVKAVDGKGVHSWEDLAGRIAKSQGREMSLSISRGQAEPGSQGKDVEIKLQGTAENEEFAFLEGSDQKEKFYKIGIVREFERKDINFYDALKFGSYKIWIISKFTVRSLYGMLLGVISPRHISGPITIFRETARTAKKGMEHLIDFMVLLSVSLAVLNLLPIPILDGGHIMFFIIEAVKGSPVNLKVQEIANQVGMFLLLLLMVFAVGNDLFRL